MVIGERRRLSPRTTRQLLLVETAGQLSAPHAGRSRLLFDARLAIARDEFEKQAQSRKLPAVRGLLG